MKLSFIVPVYNTKKTLENCVDSVMAQLLEDGTYEIILVNDGSTDGSDELCWHLSEIHPCISVLSQKNLGVSVARNSGIRAARGEYLCFIDSDDSLILGEIATLLSFCDGKSDLVRYWYKLVYPGGSDQEGQGNGAVIFDGSGRDYLLRYGLETFCCNYLYRKAFIESNNLYFTPDIIAEDFSYIFDVMMANPHIVSVARRAYLYNIHPDSISSTRSPEHSRRWVQDLLGSMSRIARELARFQESDPIFYEVCSKSLEAKYSMLFSRILSAHYTIAEYRVILEKCRNATLLPLRFRHPFILSILTTAPSLYPLASALFRRLFLPYIYPKINRNGQ